MEPINETHDPKLTSWVSSANQDDTDFPIQNLPFAVFRKKQSSEAFRGGVAIGDQVLDMSAVAAAGIFDETVQKAVLACAEENLNRLMGMGKQVWSALRQALSKSLRTGAAEQTALQHCLIPQGEVEYKLPCTIGDYTDFYTSIHHATAVGSLFRPDNPLLPNYKWVPVGYHGRASSIIISGEAIHRPQGQTKSPDSEQPALTACKRLDYEVEVGIFIGPGNALGSSVSIEEAEDHVFGFCLLNDWSARDIQAWEYQPLGPFLGKSFATAISPWIVTLEAMAPFRLPFKRDKGEPEPLPYLSSTENTESGSFDLKLECLITTETSRAQGDLPFSLSTSSFKYSYWTTAQMVTHHTINGCNLNPGDLFGSGTQSGPDPSEAGSLLELSKGGKEPIALENGEKRGFLEDGDSIIMRGWCEREGARRIGFGEVINAVLPVRDKA